MSGDKNTILSDAEGKKDGKSLNFIEQIIENDIRDEKNNRKVQTRFPPEPNGYLHIGHAKSICLNFGLAKKYKGKCNLRFDDTNPEKESMEYINSIKEDVKWLGFDWGEKEFYASDYFDRLYQWAVRLIREGKAYICELTPEQVSEYRGVPTRPGTDSPYRDRSVEENLALFEKMKNGEIPEGKMFLRAKIDMASPNMHMRDPVLYRIKKAHHPRTGDKWCIYPMYDYAHGQSDYLEVITHSICTLEFEVHRPLYDWLLDQLYDPECIRPRQIEFARLNMTYTVMSKRKLLQLVQEKFVNGWDDPRMPTISGLRRRGYTPESIRNFAETIGVAKRENVIDVSLLEFSVREDLNKRAPRLMCAVNPLKVVITNYPENGEEWLDAVNNPEDESMGTRKLPFSGELFIEQDDFMEDAPKNYFRLTPGAEVRLRYAYYLKCNEIVKDAGGNISQLLCTYDPLSKGGYPPDGRKVKATIHWVSAKHAVSAEVRLYDRLFMSENPEESGDFLSNLNPESLKVMQSFIEPHVKTMKPGDKCQFERLGYFCMDKDSTEEKPVFNRTVALKDTWAKISGKK
ncbi:MAG: glutamine--tRNA ligase/YqeY domain fusion protein [Bacteroidota bacterium]